MQLGRSQEVVTVMGPRQSFEQHRIVVSPAVYIVPVRIEYQSQWKIAGRFSWTNHRMWSWSWKPGGMSKVRSQ